MGWWSSAVMGGDPSFDWLIDFEKALGLDPDHTRDEAENKVIAKQLEQKESDLVSILGLPSEYKDEQEYRVGWQVLGYLMLRCGAFFTKETRDRIIDAAMKDDSSLFLRPQLRKLFMLDLIEKVANHSPGQCTELAGDMDDFSDSTPSVRSIYTALVKERDDVVDRMMSVAQFHGYTFDADKLRRMLQKVAPSKES